jgi:hypothetical protein
VAALVIVGTSLAPPGQADFSRADRETVRLTPSAFGDLAEPVRADLVRRGCTVPQPFLARRDPQNVIRGRFFSPASTDVAVLCSIAGTSSILVYRDGAPPAAAELSRLADATFLQVVDGSRVGFSRGLSVAAAARIRSKAPTIAADHDGIEDAFIEKGSSIWYWSGGRWVQLPGAD